MLGKSIRNQSGSRSAGRLKYTNFTKSTIYYISLWSLPFAPKWSIGHQQWCLTRNVLERARSCNLSPSILLVAVLLRLTFWPIFSFGFQERARLVAISPLLSCNLSQYLPFLCYPQEQFAGFWPSDAKEINNLQRFEFSKRCPLSLSKFQIRTLRRKTSWL